MAKVFFKNYSDINIPDSAFIYTRRLEKNNIRPSVTEFTMCTLFREVISRKRKIETI